MSIMELENGITTVRETILQHKIQWFQQQNTLLITRNAELAQIIDNKEQNIEQLRAEIRKLGGKFTPPQSEPHVLKTEMPVLNLEEIDLSPLAISPEAREQSVGSDQELVEPGTQGPVVSIVPTMPEPVEAAIQIQTSMWQEDQEMEQQESVNESSGTTLAPYIVHHNLGQAEMVPVTITQNTPDAAPDTDGAQGIAIMRVM